MSNLKEFESKELKCSICLDFFQNPRTLNCQHSFCSKCLDPLVKEKVFSCPQCRHSCYFDTVEKIPRNSLLTNLVTNIKSTKAACPECKELNDLNVCEHCSQIFCEGCLDKHMKKTLEKLDNRLATIETLPSIIESLKSNIKKSEQEALSKMLDQMNKIQTQILSLWQTRKYTLIDEIRRFYKLKTDEIDLAEFRLRVLGKSLIDLNKRKNTLETSVQSRNSRGANEANFYTNLTRFEIDLVDLELKFKDSFSNFDINTNELKIKYNELDNVEIFKSILDNVKLISCSNKDEQILDNVIEPSKLRKEIAVKDYFGNTACIHLSSDPYEAIDKLKDKLRLILGIEAKYINFIDKRTNQVLDDKLELVFSNGKLYAKKQDETCQETKQLPEDEIELFISYKNSKSGSG